MKKYNKKEIEIMEELDNETVEIDSELVRTREHRSRQRKKIDAMKRVGAPDLLIKYEEYLAKMTHSEYLYELQIKEDEFQKRKQEYCNTRKMDELVLEKLFNRFDCLMESTVEISCGGSRMHFNNRLDPLAVMPENDYYMGLYDPLLDSFFKQYCDKWKVGMDYWNDNDEDNIVVTDNQKNTRSKRERRKHTT